MEKLTIKDIYNILFMEYGPQSWWPVYSLINTEYRDDRGYFITNVPLGIDSNLLLNNQAGNLLHINLLLDKLSKYEIAIGAILTQNTAWTNVEKALSNLIELNMIDPNILLDLNKDKLAEQIRPSGYYNQKAKKIQVLTNFLLESNYLEDGKTPDRDNLLGLWGIGDETADSILLYAYNVPVFVVDAYTKRIFLRLGLLKGNEKYGEIASLFTDNLETEYLIFQEYHALIVRHAKEHCKKTPNCEGCVLYSRCLKSI